MLSIMVSCLRYTLHGHQYYALRVLTTPHSINFLFSIGFVPNKGDVALVRCLVEANGTRVVSLANGAWEKHSSNGRLSPSRDAPLASKQFSYVDGGQGVQGALGQNVCGLFVPLTSARVLSSPNSSNTRVSKRSLAWIRAETRI